MNTYLTLRPRVQCYPDDLQAFLRKVVKSVFIAVDDHAQVVSQPVAAPVRDIERRIGEDEVGLQVRVTVVVEGVAVLYLSFDAAYGEVHLGEPPSGVVRLLPVDEDVGPRSTAVCPCLR